MSRRDTRLYNATSSSSACSRSNCSGGLTMTKAPERWDASWDNNVKAARLSDEAGLEFILPVGRWHGYRGETDTEGTSFETLTWASGLLASTRDLCVFGTLHVAFINPGVRGQADRHRRPHRQGTVRPQHRVGLERRRVRHVRHRASRSTTSATPTPRNGSTSSSGSGAEAEAVRLRWREFQAQGVEGKPKPWFGRLSRSW